MEETKEEKLERERAQRELEAKSEFEQLQETRRTLPMFPYRCAVCMRVGGEAWVGVGGCRERVGKRRRGRERSFLYGA